MIDRRQLIIASGAAMLAPLQAQSQSLTHAPIKVGLTKVFLDDQIGFVRTWQHYLEARLNRPVDFVQRQTYREIVDPLREGRLGFAWICGYPYVRHRDQLRLVAVPLFEGKPLYRSYLIASASDSATRSLEDLRGKVFAFSDPDSNSGHLYPRYQLHQRNTTPAAFFARTFFTLAHRKVVDAVAKGVAHGGAVDGYVWETLARLHPDLTRRTRVVEKSPQFGHPPFVASTVAATATVDAMQAVLVGMADDDEGAALLRQLNLDGFVPSDPTLFDSIATMMRAVDRA